MSDGTTPNTTTQQGLRIRGALVGTIKVIDGK